MKLVSKKLYALWRGAYEKFGYETIECDTGIAEHLQLTKFAVLSTVLELQADLVLTLRVLRQFEGNSRSIVRCKMY